MKLIKQSVEYLPQAPGLEGIYKQIELVGRTCYKSQDKITEGSAKPFVNRMIESQHYSMLEHGTVYLAMPMESILPIAANGWGKYAKTPYAKGFKVCTINGEKKVAVTTNLRVLVENGWLDDLQYLCEPIEYHARRISLKFITSIGISREANRHRSFSIAEQSTRYCNFSKDKFGKEITFIKPSWYDEWQDDSVYSYVNMLEEAGDHYMYLIDKGWKPQQAREVLPLSTATEVVYTAFEDDWRHFFDLRYRGTTGAPHPNMQEIATMAHDVILRKLGKDL